MLNLVKQMTTVSDIFSKKKQTLLYLTNSDMYKYSLWIMDKLMKDGFRPSPDLASTGSSLSIGNF